MDIGGPKFLFILLGRVFLLCKTMILGGLGGVREYWLLNVRFFVIHKVKQTKNCSFYKNEKIANFQTKVDFNDLRWINGSLWYIFQQNLIFWQFFTTWITVHLSQVSQSVFIEKSDLRLTWNHNYAGEVQALGNMTINRIADLKRVAGIRYLHIIFTF